MDKDYKLDPKDLGPVSGLPPTAPQGPRRKAPRYYIGETVGGRWRPQGRRGAQHKQIKLGGAVVNYGDVERYPNGAVAGLRNKAARRIIRKAFMTRASSVESGLRLLRAMKAQALEIAKEQHKSTRHARRLVKQELALHIPVYCPNKKTLRAMRTENRRRKRKGLAPLTSVNDAISQMVDKLGK